MLAICVFIAIYLVYIAIYFSFYLRQCSFIHSYGWHAIWVQHEFIRFKKFKRGMENLELKILYVQGTFSLQLQKMALLKWNNTRRLVYSYRMAMNLYQSHAFTQQKFINISLSNLKQSKDANILCNCFPTSCVRVQTMKRFRMQP